MFEQRLTSFDEKSCNTSGYDLEVSKPARNEWNAIRSTCARRSDVETPGIELKGRLNRRGNTVIEVSDNGPGVPEENTRKIFVPFFTTREGGSGVGLALARQVMIAHGGFIRLGHEGDTGATFTLTF